MTPPGSQAEWSLVAAMRPLHVASAIHTVIQQLGKLAAIAETILQLLPHHWLCSWNRNLSAIYHDEYVLDEPIKNGVVSDVMQEAFTDIITRRVASQ